MKILVIPILFLPLLACNGPSKVKSQNAKEVSRITEESRKSKQILGPYDTLNDPNHPYYLTNKDPKEFGRMILEDKVQPSDNLATFNVMDSLLSTNVEDRQFYLKVFLHILDKADGALAEAIGLPAMNYIEKYPIEFAQLTTVISDDRLDFLGSYIGYEIYLSSQDDPLKDGEDFVEKLRSNCQTLKAEAKTRLEKFNDIIIKSIKENNE
jgi:hypothetical protein